MYESSHACCICGAHGDPNSDFRICVCLSYHDHHCFSEKIMQTRVFAILQVQIFGQDVLEYYSLDGYSVWEFIAYEIIFFIGFFGLCWFALSFIKHQKR